MLILSVMVAFLLLGVLWLAAVLHEHGLRPMRRMAELTKRPAAEIALVALVAIGMIHHGATKGTNGDLIVIRIEDTGEGMDEDTLLRVRAEIEAGGHPATAQTESDLRNERRVGIGLGNVAWRIRDVYKDGNMTIESRKGEGTVVTLFIPEVSDE